MAELRQTPISLLPELTEPLDAGAWIPVVQSGETFKIAAGDFIGDGSGDVVGPSSSVDNRLATFDGTTGKLIQDSGVLLSDLAVSRNVVTTVTSSGGTATLDLSLGDYFQITLTENTTIVVTNPPAAGSHSLRITQHASAAKTVTFPVSFLKQGGGDFVVSTALGARDRIIFTHDDAGTSYDADLGKAFA